MIQNLSTGRPRVRLVHRVPQVLAGGVRSQLKLRRQSSCIEISHDGPTALTFGRTLPRTPTRQCPFNRSHGRQGARCSETPSDLGCAGKDCFGQCCRRVRRGTAPDGITDACPRHSRWWFPIDCVHRWTRHAGVAARRRDGARTQRAHLRRSDSDFRPSGHGRLRNGLDRERGAQPPSPRHHGDPRPRRDDPLSARHGISGASLAGTSLGALDAMLRLGCSSLTNSWQG